MQAETTNACRRKSLRMLTGHVARVRALSRRLLFVDLQLNDGDEPCCTVVIKEQCGGTGGAADARHVLKVGDFVCVEATADPGASAPDSAQRLPSFAATSIEVLERWRDVGGGRAWAPRPPLAAAESEAASAAAPTDVKVCHRWLNTGRCARDGCTFRHWSPDVKVERGAYVEERRRSRLELAAAASPALCSRLRDGDELHARSDAAALEQAVP